MTHEEFRQILAHLRNATRDTEWEGHLYAVGGCCRDELMGLPIKDIDLVVDLPDGGIRFATWLKEKGLVRGKVVSYPGFGTAMLHLKAFPDDELEFVHTRKESYPDIRSRNPVTRHGTIQEDCLRRDLTINALYKRVSDGQLLDVCGTSVQDIGDHMIRTPNDPLVTYQDDPLRILRTVRFASRYGWDIEPGTFAGMVERVPRLEIITKERIATEFTQMLCGPDPVRAMRLLRETGAMHFVVPELESIYHLRGNLYIRSTAWDHSLAMLGRIQSPGEGIRLASLLHGLDAKVAGVALQRLRYSGDIVREVMFLIENHLCLWQAGPNAENLPDRDLRMIQDMCGTNELFMRLMELIDAYNKTLATGHDLPEQVNAVTIRTKAMIEAGTALFGYVSPLNGIDIMRLIGLPPGPGVREYLDYIRTLSYEDPIRPREEWEALVTTYKPAHTD